MGVSSEVIAVLKVPDTQAEVSNTPSLPRWTAIAVRVPELKSLPSKPILIEIFS